MFNKIFLGLIAFAVLIMGLITFITYSQLQSIGFAPARIVENFAAYDSLYKSVLWISSLILLVLANVVLWTGRRAWALWLTYAYFAVFTMLNMWWLSEARVFYEKQNGLFDGSFHVGGLIGALLVIVVGVGVFFNQFLVLRMTDKLYPATAAELEEKVVEPALDSPGKEDDKGSERPADVDAAETASDAAAKKELD